MIIKKASLIPSDNLPKTCWAGIRRFHNVSFVFECIRELHSIPKKQEANARKQAEQIRYCLIQAKEYFDASLAVTLATKPVLLYYSIMSLALAEILLKQDGMSSLDKARGEHAHHGLELRIDPSNKEHDLELHSLRSTAGSLRAVPPSRNGKRFGTFELWHRSSRELPLCGEVGDRRSGSIVTSPCQVIFGPADTPMRPLAAQGIVFLSA
jgi:hypothetical protein